MHDLKAAWTQLRAAALSYPDTYEESPWGERAIKVRKKIFVFLGGGDGQKLSFSLKLPESRVTALELEQAFPTHYGMGKHGWVSFSYELGQEVPLPDVLDWVDESFRAVAPKRLVRTLGQPRPPEPVPERTLEGRALLLAGDDPLRLERAQKALVARGADVLCVPLDGALDAAGDGAPDAVVLDLSRNAKVALDALPELGLVSDGAMIVAGIRDAKMQRTVVALPGISLWSREPPGDPVFVDQLVGQLG